jgi:hypothetical protein
MVGDPSLCEAVEPGNVHAAGGDFVEQRLPQMRARLLNQRNVGTAASAQCIAEPGDEPAGASAADDNAIEERLSESAPAPGPSSRSSWREPPI